MEKKAEIDILTNLQGEVRECSRYSDLKELYSKVIPSISNFEKKMIEQNSEIEQCKQMMYRLDEVMANKASKLVLDDVLFRMRGLVTIGTLQDLEKS